MKLWTFSLFVCLHVCLTYGAYNSEIRSLYTSLITGYNPDVRPDSSVNVSVGLTVLSMDLDSIEETLAVSGKLTVMWDDLSWNLNTLSSHEVFHVRDGVLWRPELVIENMVGDIGVINDENSMYRVHYSGVTMWEPAVNMKVRCQHDFTYYPFDKQTCSITVSSWSYDNEETTLQALNDEVKLNLYRESSEFQVGETWVETSNVTENQDTITRSYSKLTFYLTVERHTQYYGLTILLPLVLMSALTTLTFLLPAESGEKANYSITVLLMLVILYSIALMYYPLFKGVSVLVVYAAVVLILAALAVLCNILVLYLYHQDKHREMQQSMRSVLRILEGITCRRSAGDDTKSIVMSEETASSRLSEHDLHICSSLPNGNLGDKKPGRLSPINRRVGPSETIVGKEAGMSTVQETMPPMNSEEQSDPGEQSNTQNVSELIKMSKFTDKRHQLKDNIRSHWQDMSLCLDRLFFLMFIVTSFITHFIFLIVLGTGST